MWYWSKTPIQGRPRCKGPRRSFSQTSVTRFGAAVPSFYDSTVEKYALQPVTKLSLNYMLEFGRNAYDNEPKVLQSASFVIDLMLKAHRLMDLHYLPWVVATNPHIHKVYQTYFTSFNLTKNLPIVTTLSENDQLNSLLRELIELNAPVIDELAIGLKECRQKLGQRHSKLQLDSFLDSMLRSRISRRLMTEQHLGLQSQKEGWVGTVQLQLSLWDLCSASAREVSYVCSQTYGQTPELNIKGDRELNITYIPGHLRYVLYELFKNAFRATVEHHTKKKTLEPIPDIEVTLCEMSHGVTIRISDKGGGVDPSQLEDVFRYGFTTGHHSSQMDSLETTVGLALQQTDTSLMAGLGFGLPMARLFARFFGGDLTLVSIPGYGTDAYLSIKSLSYVDLEAENLTVV